MKCRFGRNIVSGAAQFALLITALGSVAEAASPVTVTDTRVFPESITVTSDGTLLIAGSEKGIIYKAASGATTAQAWISREQAGFEGFLLGIYADEPHGVFYVCSDVAGPPRQAAFKSFDLKTGALKATYHFPGGGLCNDFVTAPDGTLYATDTVLGRILRLKPAANEPDIWASDPGLAEEPSPAHRSQFRRQCGCGDDTATFHGTFRPRRHARRAGGSSTHCREQVGQPYPSQN
jgi:hypothetical protein